METIKDTFHSIISRAHDLHDHTPIQFRQLVTASEPTQANMPANFGNTSTSTQGQTKITDRYRHRSPESTKNNAAANDLTRVPPSALKKKLSSSRKKIRQQTRANHQMQQKYNEVLSKHGQLSQKYKVIQQEHQEMQKGRQELIRDHQKLQQEQLALRKDNHELHQEIQKLRLEPERERRKYHREHQDLQRAHQLLHSENQDLQCVVDELRQELAMGKFDKRRPRDELEQKDARFDSQLDHYKSRYEYIVNQIVQSYAAKHGLEFKDCNRERIDKVLQPLLHDALRASAL
ncbi:hypothetical protein OPT61_g4675 [Boeremia exigua]|uniref:Uncharacterized protein n=1 Tax=Boeremia exigua TaxID=749465 RepID=A0ACC2ID88_9PLEO|nr:hypothetical protein OPT61_g4675 [Boeremia exigua]